MTVISGYAVEDAVSEAVTIRCMRFEGIVPGHALGRRGNGHLKQLAQSLNQSAAGMPYLMLTDLDSGVCAPELVADWMGGHPLHPDFLFRVAIKEVEAWLLADYKGLAKYLGVQQSIMPRDFDGIADPKHELLMVARRSRFRKIREDIVFEANHGPIPGPDYNGALSRFVAENWAVETAAERSPSLGRMLLRLRELRARKS